MIQLRAVVCRLGGPGRSSVQLNAPKVVKRTALSFKSLLSSNQSVPANQGENSMNPTENKSYKDPNCLFHSITNSTNA